MKKIDIVDGAAELWENTIDDIVKEQPVSQDYFEFKYSTGNDIGRTYPQAEYVFFSPAIESSSDLSRFPEPEDFSGKVILKNSAKLTDFISNGNSGKSLMMSSKCFEIVRRFNLGEHKHYSFTCVHKDIEHDFVFLALSNPMMEYIDYSTSVFYISNLFDRHLRDITFSSKDDMFEYSKKIGAANYGKEGYSEGLLEDDVNLKQVYIKSDFQNLDIITWRATHFFSKGIADAIGLNKISGLRFKETRRVFK